MMLKGFRVSLRCERLLAVANTALTTIKHINFNKEKQKLEHEMVETTSTLTHPSRDSEGYPLNGVDEVDGYVDEPYQDEPE